MSPKGVGKSKNHPSLGVIAVDHAVARVDQKEVL